MHSTNINRLNAAIRMMPAMGISAKMPNTTLPQTETMSSTSDWLAWNLPKASFG